jgi:uncharacterized membrane protein
MCRLPGYRDVVAAFVFLIVQYCYYDEIYAGRQFLPESATATLVSEIGGSMAGKPAFFVEEIGAGCSPATS